MHKLTEEQVIDIAKAAAMANNVSFTTITTAPAFDSTGAEAIEIKITLIPGSSDAIRGERSARTVADVVRGIADAGEERFPIVRYGEGVIGSST